MHEHDAPERPIRALFADRLGRWALRAVQVLAIVLLVAVAIFVLVQVRVLVIPVIIAVILAAAGAPLIDRLRRAGVHPTLAAWIVLVAALVVLSGIVAGVVFAVRREWSSIVDSAAEGFEEFTDWVTSLPIPIDRVDWDGIADQVSGFVTSAQFGSGAIAGVSTAIEIVTGAVLMVVVLYFFLKDGDRIWAFLLGGTSPKGRRRGQRIGRTAVEALGGYARGTAVIAAVDAVVIGATLLILQVPLAIPLAALIFLGAFVPIVGATVTGVLAALVALVTNGLPAALIVGAVIILVNQLEGDLLQPIVMSKAVRLHPLAILLALTAGTLVAGIAGALLAVPIAAVGWAIVRVWDAPEKADEHSAPQEGETGTDPEPSST